MSWHFWMQFIIFIFISDGWDMFPMELVFYQLIYFSFLDIRYMASYISVLEILYSLRIIQPRNKGKNVSGQICHLILVCWVLTLWHWPLMIFSLILLWEGCSLDILTLLDSPLYFGTWSVCAEFFLSDTIHLKSKLWFPWNLIREKGRKYIEGREELSQGQMLH